MAGKISVVGNKLYFHPTIYPTSIVKEIGFRWSKSKKAWIAPLSLSAYTGLTEIYSTICSENSVNDWLSEINALTIPPSIQSHEKAFEYQKQGSAFLLKHRKALLGFAPGLGKTITAILAAQEVRGKILVVCPLTLFGSWQDEIKKWANEDSTIWHGKPENWPEATTRWVITNYDTAVRQMVSFEDKKAPTVLQNMTEFSCLIVDESILVKNRKAKRTRAVKALAKKVPYTWLLSGSPTSRYIDDFWGQLNIVNPTVFSSYWRFVRRYCQIVETVWGLNIVGNKDNAKEILHRDLADIYLSRTQEQVQNLPDWIFKDISVKMGKEQAKAYQQMETTFFADLPEGDTILAPNVLAQLTRLVQLSSNTSLLGGANHGAKWEALKELLEYVQLPAIIWTNFKETAKQLEEFLPKTLKKAVLTGDTRKEDRHDIVQRFQQGKLDILIAHPGVGKFGLTLTACKTAIYLERNFSGDDYYQSLHRIKRIGTKESPTVIHLLATYPNGTKTIDHIINYVLKDRKNNSIALTTGLLRQFKKGEI